MPLFSTLSVILTYHRRFSLYCHFWCEFYLLVLRRMFLSIWRKMICFLEYVQSRQYDVCFSKFRDTPRDLRCYFEWCLLINENTWWRHQMEVLSALLALCVGNIPVTGESPSQRPVTRSFHVFFDLRLNKRLSHRTRRWWFETPSRALWRHYNDVPNHP